MLFSVANNDNRQSLGRQFHFVRRIGTGGLGEVYLAEMSTASGFAKMVAIKLLRSELSGNEELAERMRDEARLLGMLQHRTIVQAEDLISNSGRVAVVMEVVPGCNWSAVVHPEINKQPIPPRVVLDMVPPKAEEAEMPTQEGN
jgi:serine/threonine-protein kinase